MVPLEDHEAENFSSYLTYRKFWHTHIANERKAHPKYHEKLARMGLSKGFPDYLILLPTNTQGLCTVFVELKKRRDLLKNGEYSISQIPTSNEQTAWIEELNKCEHTEAVVCYGADECIDYVEMLEKL